MIHLHVGSLAAICVLSVSVPAFAAGGTLPSALGLRLVVTPEGAFYRPSHAPAVAGPGGGASGLLPGLIWKKTDGGLGWIGTAVSIGYFGTEVFSEYDENNESDELFSVFDASPPTALFTNNSPLGSTDRHVASANATNLRVSLHEFNQATPASTAVLSAFTGYSGTPDWTYTFSFPINGGTDVGVSRDGQKIVAAVSNYAAGTVDIVVFSPASSVPLSYTVFSLGSTNNAIRGFDLSADGSTLYFSAGGNPVNAYIFDVATNAVVFSTPIGASFDSHAISGDGSVFAFGGFNSMKLFEKVGGVYTNTFTRIVPGANFCAHVDISDDGSTVACGYTFYDQYLRVQIEALDVASHGVTMTDTVLATGALQNVVADISICADGRRFAVGLWGDGPGPVAEARLYARNQNAAVGTVDLPGSVFSIAIAADGQRMVSGSKAVHANTLGNGGELNLYGDATPYTSYCFGDGSGTACPCGNAGMVGKGCANSIHPTGAILAPTGSASVAGDTLVLHGSGMPNNSALYFQGTTRVGSVFGDGLRCAGGTVIRLGTKVNVAGASRYPAPGDLTVSVRGLVVPGNVRDYQVWYRNANATYCTAATFNLSNGVEVAWQP